MPKQYNFNSYILFLMLNLTILPEIYNIYRFTKDTEIPSAIFQSLWFVSITKTDEELSVVCLQWLINKNQAMQMQVWYKIIKIIGPLDFSLTGVLSSLATPLAEANISIFAISTYDTDYILIGQDCIDEAQNVLRQIAVFS